MTITRRKGEAMAEHGGDHRADTPEERATFWWWLGTFLSWLLLFVVGAVLLLMIVVPRVTGAQAYTVLTGSMEPTYAPGALVVVKPTPAEDLRAGDAITFQPYSGNPAVVTHRITGTFFDAQGQRRIYTQGDANNAPDDWALIPEQVRGKVWYSVPQLGRLNSMLQDGTRSVLIIVIAGGLIAYAAWMVGSGLRDRYRKPAAVTASADTTVPDGADEPRPGDDDTTEMK